ncbi:MAG: glycoside hydrolase family 3 protein, partial [Acidimicrobiia bacterium]|nr:glycoside hydrolase family 3 protein [Acidimicrobiia bacterium]
MTLAEKLAQMTLVEKNSIAPSDLGNLGIGGLLSGGGGAPATNTPEGWAEMVRDFQERTLASRLGIPLIYGIDAVHGHSNVPGAVLFPHNIGLGAANDPDLMERIGEVTALEVLATNIHWNYAPAVSVPLDIRWGRTYEGYSQDTATVTELATAYLRGMQGGDLADPTTILGTPKHFVGDGGTAWGSSTTGTYTIDQGVTEVDEETLRAIHLPPYIDAIEAGAMSIMASYSSWDGLKMHAQQYLMTDVLKGELGFEGFIVSDWEAIDQITDDYYEAVVTSINAGIDMNMVPRAYRTFIEDLTTAVEVGDVPMERIDDAVRRILRVKFALGLFEQPFGDESLLAEVGSDAHRAVAREAVAKSVVLLKDDAALLPLSPDIERIWVGGQAANDLGTQLGGWSITWQGSLGARTEGTTTLDAIEAAVSPDTVV